MMDFYIEHLFPHFILADKQGWPLAKAMMAGINLLQEWVDDGMTILRDIANMPEWRLDEVAWEQNLIYDYQADCETKRQLVLNQDKDRNFNVYGTPYALKQYIKGVEKEAVVREWFEYNGDPYHFRIDVDGRVNSEKNTWCEYIIENVKNVRSVLDTLKYVDEEKVQPIYSGCAVICAEKSHLYCSTDNMLQFTLDDETRGVLNGAARLG